MESQPTIVLRNSRQSKQVRPRVGVVVLAAGSSSRMNLPKLALTVGEDTLLGRAIDAACASEADDVVVVTGAYRSVYQPIVDAWGVQELFNEAWSEGQASSVRCAVEYARTSGWEAMLCMVADQPAIDSIVLNRLMEHYRATPARAHVSRAAGADGSPCLFDCACFDELTQLKGDQGARKRYRDWGKEQVHYVDYSNPHFFTDIDTPEDLAAYDSIGFQSITAASEGGERVRHSA